MYAIHLSSQAHHVSLPNDITLQQSLFVSMGFLRANIKGLIFFVCY